MKLLTSFLILLSSLSLIGQEISQYQFHNIKVEDEIKYSEVNDFLKIFQDTLGFTWVVTLADGLQKFDGYQFKKVDFKNDNNEVITPSSGFGLSAEIDKKGMIWLHSFDHPKGIYKLNPYEEKIAFIDAFIPPIDTQYLREEGYSSIQLAELENKVLNIEAEANGGILIGTIHGLFHYNIKTDSIHQILYDTKKLEIFPAPSNDTSYFHFGIKNIKEGGLTHYCYDKNSKKPFRYNLQPEIKQEIFIGSGKNEWVWEANNLYGLRHRNLKTGEYQTILDWKDNQSLKYENISWLGELPNGELWVAWEGTGVLSFSGDYKKPKLIRHNLSDKYSLTHNALRDVFIDLNNNYWIATRNGISILPEQHNSFRQFVTEKPDNIDPNSDSGAHSFCELNDQEIILGTEFGLYLFDKKTNEINQNFYKYPNLNQFSTRPIYNLFKDKDGFLWIITFDLIHDERTVFFYNPNQNQLDSLNSLKGFEDISNVVKKVDFLFEDKTGNTYASSTDVIPTLIKVSTNKDSIKKIDYGGVHLYNNSCFFDKSKEELWLGTEQGVYIYHLPTKKYIQLKKEFGTNNGLSDNYVYAFLQDTEKNMWVGTAVGLNKVNSIDKSIRQYLPSDGLPGKQIVGLLEDSSGNIWIAFLENGIAKLNPKTNEIVAYSMADGLKTMKFWSHFKDKDGHFYFGDDLGFTTFHPDSVQLHHSIPPIHITGLKLFNQSVSIGGPDSILPQPITNTSDIQLAYNQNMLTFEYAALNYINSEKNKYAYQLEGFDTDWQYVGNKREVTFTNLDPGKYVFRVKGANQNGIWNELGDSLRIHILPPWWQTWWAKTFYGLLLIGILYSIRKMELQKQHRKLAIEKEKLEREKDFNRQLKTINEANQRFVPQDFLDILGKDSITQLKLGDSTTAKMTILFADIRSYTTLSEKMSPEDNFKFINAFLGRIGPVIEKHGGFINQYLGDGVMALFIQNHEACLNAAIEMQQTIKRHNEKRQSKGRIPIKMGVGLNTGQLMLGIIGDPKRYDSSVISDAVNTASRMEGLTKFFGASIILSEFTLSELTEPKTYQTRYLGQVQVKGKQQALKIYECFDGDEPAEKDLKLATAKDFELGVLYYLDKAFAKSALAFKEVLAANPQDKTAQLFLDRADKLAVAGVPDNWTGVEMMEGK